MTESIAETKLLRAAKSLMLSRGYPATTVDAICEEAGVTKGSFYHYFGSKEDLGVAVLQHSLEEGGRILGEGAYQDLEDPVDRALGYLGHVESCALQLWGNGCLLGTFSLDLADTNPRMQQAVSSMFREVSDTIAAILEPVAAAGNSDSSPSELADHFLACLEGAIILAKAHRNPGLIPGAIRHFRRSIENLLVPSATPIP